MVQMVAMTLVKSQKELVGVNISMMALFRMKQLELSFSRETLQMLLSFHLLIQLVICLFSEAIASLVVTFSLSQSGFFKTSIFLQSQHSQQHQ